MNDVTVWEEQKNEIRKSFGKNLNDAQFMNFMEMGKALQLNPFLREIFAISYGGTVSIFIGRDGYRRNANAHPNYDGHTVDSIFENDNFRVVNGLPEHEYSTGDRGRLMGAYCVCWKKNTRVPYFVQVKLSEYFNGSSPIWTTKKETMIKKVAEAQCLKGAFPDIFRGTYDESENWKVEIDGEEIQQTEPKKISEAKPIPTVPKHNQAVKPLPEDTPRTSATPLPELPTATSAQQPDNKKYNIEQKPIDVTPGALLYDPATADPELDPLYRSIMKGWGMLKYHDVHRANSLKDHLDIKSLNECKDKELLTAYLQDLRDTYKATLGA